MELEIGALRFASKAEATAHFQRMLQRYDIGEQVGDADAAELRALIERHPTREQKVGCGITGFAVERATRDTRRFCIIRTDWSTTDFSYLKCIDGAPSARDQLFAALRHEVAEDILQARLRYFAEHGNADGQVQCALTGVLVSLEQSHADHAPPFTFHVLASSWVQARKLVPGADLLTPPADNQLGRLLRDRALAADWVRFHHSLAHVRVVAAGENIRRSHIATPRAADRQLALTHSGGNTPTGE